NAIAADPRGALIAELDRPHAARIAQEGLLTSGEAARTAFNFQQALRAARQSQRVENETSNSTAANSGSQPQVNGSSQPAPPRPAPAPQNRTGFPSPQQIYLDEAKARLQAALAADIGFVERLAWFWSNHFCVSADKVQVRAICGAYEREAIRPHVTGRFADML